MPSKTKAESPGSRNVVFHIGYHKTGTTWLQENLFGDPTVGFKALGRPWVARQDIVAPRDLEFCAADVRRKYTPSIEAAWSEHLVPVFSDERFSGQPFSGGYDSKEIADRIAAVFPGSRILMVIREQRRMLYSAYDEYVWEGGVAPVQRFLHPRRRHVVPQFCFEHFMYDRLIRYYFDRFGRDSVLVLSFEQFQGDSTAFLDRITRFCGASVERLPDAARRSNPGRAPCLVQLRRRLNYFLRRDELNGQSHMRVPHLDYYFTKFSPILEGCTPAFLNRRAGDKIRQVIEREVEGMFGESNRATAKLTGLDLEAAGYDMT